MPNKKSAKKRIIKSEKLRKYNASKKSMIRTFIKKIKKLILLKNIKKAKKYFSITQKIIDIQSQKKLIHKNKASRYKSQLSLKINNLNKKIQKK